MTPYDYCHQKAEESGSSFLAGFRFLPPEKRRAMTVLYAYCRELDDVADDCADPAVASTPVSRAGRLSRGTEKMLARATQPCRLR